MPEPVCTPISDNIGVDESDVVTVIFPTNVPSGAPPTKVVFDSDNPIMLDLPWFATTFIASVAGEVQVPFSQACTLTVWVPSSLELMLATCTFDGSTELDNDTIPFTLCALIETVPAKGFPSLVVTWMAAIAVPAPAESLTLIGPAGENETAFGACATRGAVGVNEMST